MAHDAKQTLILQRIQPALSGLIDGTISSLAPIFATAFATGSSRTALIVGLATSVGAGISMTFSESISDDGKISGRGNPWLRGSITGSMTCLGGLGHTLPFLIQDFKLAVMVAMLVVVVELGIITWLRTKYLEAPIGSSIVQIVLGGVVVIAAGILLGQL